MAKVSINGLTPGSKYRLVMEPEFQDGTIDANASIEFTVPLAPPHARTAELKQKRTTYNAKNVIAPTQIVVSGTAGSQTVTVSVSLTTQFRTTAPAQVATLSVGSTTTFHGITNTNILALNGISNSITGVNTTAPRTITFTTTTTLTNGTFTTGLGTFTGTKTVKKPKLLLTIPENITDNLIWNDTVRDVVYIIYRQSANSSGIKTAARKYLNGDTFSFSSIPAIPTWTNGQIKTFGIKVKDENYYVFQFVIARYVKDSSGVWSNKFWLQGRKLADILSKSIVWGR